MSIAALVAAGVSVPAGAAPAKPSSPSSVRSSETLLLIDTSVGGSTRPVEGASVEILNPSGKVMARAVTNDNGASSLRHGALPPSFTVRVSGGTVGDQPNVAVLEAAGQHGRQDPVSVVYVDPVTTVAMHLGRLRGGHPEKHLTDVRHALGFPAWLRQSQITNGTNVLDHAALQEFVGAHGGLHDALKHLATKIHAGHSDVPELFGLAITPSLPVAGPPTPTDDSTVAPEPEEPTKPGNGNGNGNGRPAPGKADQDTATGNPADLGKPVAGGKGGGPVAGLPNAKQYREDIETSVGLYLIGSVAEGLAGAAGEAAIGSIFGTGEPTSDELASIDTELRAIETALTDIQNELYDLKALTSQAVLQDIVGDMSDIEGNTNTAWDSYDTFLESQAWVKNNDYDASIVSFANYFDKLLTPYMGQFTKLFSNPKTGYIGYFEQLYKIEASSVAWYAQTDIEHLQSAVDYYGTLQAKAVALTTEAWQTPGSTAYLSPSVVSANLPGLTKQNSNIYLSWPQDIGPNEVVIPGKQIAYSLSRYVNPGSDGPNMPAKVSRHVQYTSTPTNHYGQYITSCGQGAYYEGGNHVGTPAGSNDTTVRGWWLTAVPSGYTIGDTSDFGPLSQPRGGQFTTGILKPSGSDLEVMVTKNSVPGVSQRLDKAPDIWDTDSWHFNGWLWCHDYTLDLTATTGSSSNWDVNVYYDGHVMTPSHNFRVGVLVSRPGSWRYVQPTS